MLSYQFRFRTFITAAACVALLACSATINPGDAATQTDVASDRTLVGDVANRDDSGSAPDAIITDAAIVPTTDAATDAPVATGDGGGLIAARPYTFRRPSAYDAAVPTPLLILLHGYGATGAQQDLYFRLSTLANMRNFLYAFPDGTLDAGGRRFWNATDACCNFAATPVDDVAYVNAIIDDVSAHYNVDPHRIFIVGHSNGGFMAHRLACELSGRLAGIVNLAGAQWFDTTRCTPTSGAVPVAVLQVHGDLDATIHYAGGHIGDVATAPEYPSAHQSVADWAMRNHCTGALAAAGMTLDLDSSVLGAETHIETYAGCPGNGAVELWTIQGGGHIPGLQANWAPTIYDWLMAHPKP